MLIAELLKEKPFVQISFINDSGKVNIIIETGKKPGELLIEWQLKQPINNTDVVVALNKMVEKIITRIESDARS